MSLAFAFSPDPLVRRFLLRVQPSNAVLQQLTLDLDIICLWLFHQKRRRLAVQRIRRIGVAQELWEEDFEDVDHVVHGRPCLVDHVKAYRAGPA